jgi:hypothetical protein
MTARELGTSRAPLSSAAHQGVAVSSLIAVTVSLVASPRRFRRWFADDRVRADSRGEMAYETLARIPIGTALFEEVAFRGVLTGLLLRTMAAGPAYAVSSAAFGLWHVLPTLRDHAGSPTSGRASPTAAAFSVAITTAAGGLGFEGLRRRSNSLLTPVMAHATLNASAYLAAQLAHRQIRREAGIPPMGCPASAENGPPAPTRQPGRPRP